MVKQELNITIPTTWYDITVKQFTELERLKNNSSNKFNRIVEELSILTTLDSKEIEELSLEQINELYSRMKFLTTPINYNLVNSFKIFEITYTSSLEFGKLSYSQYVDLIEVLKQKEDNKYKISSILSILFVEEGNKYDASKTSELDDLIYNHIDIVTAYSLTVFFCNLYKDFMQVSQTFLMSKAVEKMKEIKQIMKN